MQNYSFGIAWSAEDGEYVATSVEFPGLSGLGPGPEEAIEALREAMAVAIESYLEDDEPVPEPRSLSGYSGQFRARLSRSQHAALALRAEEEGVSINALVMQYIAAGLADDRVASQSARRLNAAIDRVRRRA